MDGYSDASSSASSASFASFASFASNKSDNSDEFGYHRCERICLADEETNCRNKLTERVVNLLKYFSVMTRKDVSEMAHDELSNILMRYCVKKIGLMQMPLKGEGKI